MAKRKNIPTDFQSVNMNLNLHGEELVAHWRFPTWEDYVSDKKQRLQQWVWRDRSSSSEQRGLELNSPAVHVDAERLRDSEADRFRDPGAVQGNWDAGLGTEKIEEFLSRVGVEMFDTFCAEGVRSQWKTQFGGPQRNRGVRLVFGLQPINVELLSAALWEAIHRNPLKQLPLIQDAFALAPMISLVRKVSPEGGIEPREFNLEPPLRVLVVASNPKDAYQLKVEEEIRAILDAAEDLKGDVIVDKILPWKTPENIRKAQKALPGGPTLTNIRNLAADYHVLHFIGHGDAVTRDGHREVRLLLENEGGNAEWNDAAAITRHLRLQQTQLIVLNGCQTAAVSLLARQFPAVVAMQLRISNEAATNFSRGLYTELADSGQLDAAVMAGRQAIEEGADGKWEYRTPVLYMQSETGLLWKVRPRILTENLTVGHRNCDYKAELEAKGGRQPFVWTALGLPAGLRLDRTDEDSQATIQGTPQQSGIFPVSIRAQNRDGGEAMRQFQLTIQGEGPQKDPEIVTEQIG